MEHKILKLALKSLKREDEGTGYCSRWHTEEICDLNCLPNIIVVNISRRAKCVGMWCGWGRWYIVVCVWGETGGNERVLIDRRVMLNDSARNGLSLEWDEHSLDAEFCQAIMKTTVKHWVV
jgi:hypothetical protein